MASSKIKGITVEIGGDTTKLGKAIADAEKQSNSLKGELKQVEKLLKMDPGNTELIAQKQEILTRAVSETTEKLNVLREAQEQVEKQFKNGDIGEDQYRAFQREIIKTESELKDFSTALENVGEDIEDVGESAEKSSDGFTIMGGALADLVSNVIQGAVSAIGDFIGSIMELSEATEEYRQMQSKLEGSSKTFGYSVDFAKSKYEEFYKYLGDDQASTNAITNLMGIGAETDTISKLAEGATAVWASYGDSIPIEGLTEAINETVTVGKVTGGMADTINWAKNANEGLNKALEGNKEAQNAYNKAIKEGLPAEDAFNEALAKVTDSQERADIVAKFLNNTYGESKNTYDELNKSVMDTNEAELALKETQAQLGEVVAPVNNALTDMKNQALQAITPLVTSLANAFLDLYTWLQENPVAMKILTGVVIALASAFTVLAGALAIQGLITGVTKALAFLNTTLLANPAVLITALIVGLVASFIYLWNNCEAFREFWINLWENIKEIAGVVKDALVEFFTVTIPDAWNVFKTKSSEVISAVVTYFKELPGKIWSAIVGAVSRVATWGSELKNKAVSSIQSMISGVVSVASTIASKIWSAISGAISTVTNWGSQMISKAKSAMSSVASAISSALKSVPNSMATIGKNIVQGIWNGIKNNVTWITNKVKSFAKSILTGIKNALGIKSPSRVFRDEVGKYISEGIGVGITDNADSPIDALTELGDEMASQELALNGATIDRQITNTFTNDVTTNTADTALLRKLDGIYERLNRLQIVLDTGALVGETIDKIDAGLATRQMLSARGV